MLKQFREFAMKGNVVDLAVGVIIGAAFGNIVSSLVADIFMPIIGAITGGLDFTNYFIPLASNVTADNLEEARRQGAVVAYGRFITLAINFVIVAFILFFVVRAMNAMKKQEAVKPSVAPTRTEVLLEEIRDQLAKRQV
ncbi:large conductance mechanosensitive channel protein MscL [Aquabacter sediminis]|uniref:large conductance mechanosensitive channel protein MscL n=1 Tax=Aquabacter sediminis TaxID=3029197 RepID=UPI00237D831E|nr:large conductance mechanosensitive channel protein MscL [Aquabacter sp. P-9]MDE1569558.1 large conductance mechanosensitive channel protein MscL [Aquabacter sp. P-9]